MVNFNDLPQEVQSTCNLMLYMVMSVGGAQKLNLPLNVSSQASYSQKMADGNEDIFSPSGSAAEDIFSTGHESEGVGESPYAFTSSATISIFSSGSHSEDQIDDFFGPNLGALPGFRQTSSQADRNGERLSDVPGTYDSGDTGASSSSTSEDNSPVRSGVCMGHVACFGLNLYYTPQMSNP